MKIFNNSGFVVEYQDESFSIFRYSPEYLTIRFETTADTSYFKSLLQDIFNEKKRNLNSSVDDKLYIRLEKDDMIAVGKLRGFSYHLGFPCLEIRLVKFFTPNCFDEFLC